MIAIGIYRTKTEVNGRSDGSAQGWPEDGGRMILVVRRSLVALAFYLPTLTLLVVLR